MDGLRRGSDVLMSSEEMRSADKAGNGLSKKEVGRRWHGGEGVVGQWHLTGLRAVFIHLAQYLSIYERDAMFSEEGAHAPLTSAAPSPERTTS